MKKGASNKTPKKKITKIKILQGLGLIVGFSIIVGIIFAGGLGAIFDWVLNNPINIPSVVWVFVGSLIVAVIIAVIVSRKMLKPLSELEKAMTTVAKGDFTIQLEKNSRIEEIKKSYDSFNIMVNELRSTEVLQSDFVSNVSHEFKTPINAIEGYATLLQGEVVSKEQEEYIEKILINTKRLTDLTGGILLLSKIENQSIEPKQTLFSLDEQIRQAIVVLEPKWSKKNIDLDVSLDEINYFGCADLLNHVWINLIDNAIKFTPLDGKIEIALTKYNSSYIFYIKDTGVGIPDADKNHIFDKFYQADRSHSNEGNGLGLTLCKRILNVVGGSIEVFDNEGGGSVFTVTLPLKD